MSANANEETPECSLIPVKTVADLLGVHTRTVHRLKSAGILPKPIRFGGSVRWKRQDIERWIDRGCSHSEE